MAAKVITSLFFILICIRCGKSEKSGPFAVGPLDDAKCNVEVVEQANAEQLHSILSSIRNRTYFRLVKVDLATPCPWNAKKKKKEAKKAKKSLEFEAKKRESSRAPTAPEDTHEEPGCGSNPNPFGGGSMCSLSLEKPEPEPAEEEEAQCESEERLDNGHTMCSLATDSQQDPPSSLGFAPPSSSTTSSDFRKPFGQSDSTSFTKLPTTDPVNKTMSPHEDHVLDATRDKDGCDDVNLPTFWLDMCNNLEPAVDRSTHVNLLLNQERWTGYNGSHVWDMIYSENCFSSHGAAPAAEQSKDLPFTAPKPKSLQELCYEERVLYRLLSGMHASINIHINLNYFPPRKGKRAGWEPNPKNFMAQYGTKPEYLKNLHFAFVVLLRAIKKATPMLYNRRFHMGDMLEDLREAERTQALVRRLLDSHVLNSCSEVFSAFDESMLFNIKDQPSSAATLKKQFKGVFQNISRTLDCVTCQTCKLHAKVQLMGLGSALKILLLPKHLLSQSMTRDELVALMNTLGSFSHAISGAKRLAAMYFENFQKYKEVKKEETPFKKVDPVEPPFQQRLSRPVAATSTSRVADEIEAMDAGVGMVAKLGFSKRLTPTQEDKMIDMLLRRRPELLVLAKHYGPTKFARHALRFMDAVQAEEAQAAHVVIIGGGLAGLTAALTILDGTGPSVRVTVLEKMGVLGGNSAWASSGINCVNRELHPDDSDEIFLKDVMRSSNRPTPTPLMTALVEGSSSAVKWISDRLGVEFTHVGQLGGHSFPRTHRPSAKLVGQELVAKINKALKKTYGNTDRFKIMTKTTATHLDYQGDQISAVHYTTVKKKKSTDGELPCSHVVLATGGYANDRFGDLSLLLQHRPDLIKLPTSNGKWTTGDGIKLALGLNASTVDMKNVQVHPTGFVDLQKRDAQMKTLSAEILRGVGALLINPHTGTRFCDELGRRNYVTGRMHEQARESGFARPEFAIVLNEAAANTANKHVPYYKHKGLLQQFDSVRELVKWMLGLHPLKDGKKESELQKDLEGRFVQTLRQYNKVADNKTCEGGCSDPWGKKFFHNTPIKTEGPFIAGVVTPVLHYTMGGLGITPEGHLLDKDGSPIQGVFAAGEIVGGIHGENRLGGNALTECVVFGRAAGATIAKGLTQQMQGPSDNDPDVSVPKAAAPDPNPDNGLKTITRQELSKHNTPEDCWVQINDMVYDFTDFAEEHPAGSEAITNLAGTDGSESFLAVHTVTMLEDFDDVLVGKIKK